MKHFAFIYFMKPDPEAIRATVPTHVAHWKNADVTDYRGGPFADRSGGLITFSTESADRAAALTRNDPFVEKGLLENYWLKEWASE
ncbi:MAG: hypothetical protein GXP54_00185 [Deltaproteobacteria bacterium]|nr:hypothetical protein [Deltaproteobacteria bacterium]